MSGPQRKPDQTAISISMSKDLLARLDDRAHALGLNRSQYLAQLARQDIAAKGSLVLHEQTTQYQTSSVGKKVAEEFVDALLTKYEKKRKRKKSAKQPAPGGTPPA